MAKHIIDKDNTLKALGSINTLLSQSLQIIKKVNEEVSKNRVHCRGWNYI